jgi:hypothetical protein
MAHSEDAIEGQGRMVDEEEQGIDQKNKKESAEHTRF